MEKKLIQLKIDADLGPATEAQLLGTMGLWGLVIEITFENSNFSPDE